MVRTGLYLAIASMDGNFITGYRFAPFELDLHTGELRKHGIRVKLQEKPRRILQMLLQSPDGALTREELRARLWPADTFVDFDNGLNTAMNKLRQALGDSAENPRFIETLSRKGYRFIVPAEPLTPGAKPAARTAVEPVATRQTEPSAPRRWRIAFAVASLALVVAAGAWFAWKRPPAEVATNAPAAPSRMRLAVLQFEVLTPSQQDAYLGEAITDEMTTHLARLDPARLGVIARNSVARFHGVRKPLREIAQDLNADFLLEGSIQRLPESTRVHAQLIRASDETHVWAETYERASAEWPRLQGDVARGVARSLAIELLPGQRAALERASTTSSAAYEAYLQGNTLRRKSDEAVRRAEQLLLRAIELDPQYALAHATLAEIYNIHLDRDPAKIAQRERLSEAMARKSLELDPLLAEGHGAISRVHLSHWRFEQAEESMLQSVRLNGNDGRSRMMYAKLLGLLGRYDEAIVQTRSAMELDPQALGRSGALGWTLIQAAKYGEAQSEAQRLLASGFDELSGHWMLGSALLGQGHLNEALPHLERAHKLNDQVAGLRVDLAAAYWRGGKREQALTLARSLEGAGPGFSFLVAQLYASIEQREQALRYLEKAYEARSLSLVSVGKRREFQTLRDDPRFVKLQQKVASLRASM